jgi:hypothetical protein
VADQGHAACALLAEIDAALAGMELAQISSRGQTRLRNYESVQHSHKRAVTLFTDAAPTLSRTETAAALKLLAAVHHWLSSTETC